MKINQQTDYIQIISLLKQETRPIVLLGAKYASNLVRATLADICGTKERATAVCDNNLALQNTCCNGVPVISPQDAFSRYPDAVLVVCLFNAEKRLAVREQMEQIGFQTILDCDALFFHFLKNMTKRPLTDEQILNLINSFWVQDDLLFHEVLLFVTQKCTLNCKSCVSLVPYFKNPEHFDYEQLIHCTMNFLDASKGVRILAIFGGEPLLRPDIVELCENFSRSEHVFIIEILTNATIVPNINYQRLRELGVVVRISDYKGYSTKTQQLVEVLRRNGVLYYIVDDSDLWYEAYPPQLTNRSDAENKERYTHCIARHNNPTIYKDKYFECTFAAVRSGLTPELLPESDAVTLSDAVALQPRLQDYITQTKSLNSCRYCRFTSDVSAVVKRAVQCAKGEPL